VKPFLEYGDLAMFQNGGGRRVVFLNFRNFNDRKGRDGQTASVYKSSCRSVKWMLRYGAVADPGGEGFVGFGRIPPPTRRTPKTTLINDSR